MDDYIMDLSKMINNLWKNLNLDTEQMQNMITAIENASINGMQNISFPLLTDEMQNYIATIKENENLTEKEFEDKYSKKIEICKHLGRAGWVVSNHFPPRVIEEWNNLLQQERNIEIVNYFEDDSNRVIQKIINELDEIYDSEPNRKYYKKSREYFEQGDYMTSAMYLSALLDCRTSLLIKFPAKLRRHSEKYCRQGFDEHIQNEYVKTNSFIKKRFLFLNMYPSLIEFLKRLLVENKENMIGSGIEPSYLNRDWLLHGRSCRGVVRCDCIQLFNALCVLEFVTSVNDVEESIEDGIA